MLVFKPAAHWQAFRELLGLLNRHRQLAWELAKREFGERYAGSVLGRPWAVLHPVALLTVYVVVFAVIFKAEIKGPRELPLDYTAFLITGFVPWFAIQEVLVKSSSVIPSNASLVKQVVFPVEILVVKSVVVSLITQLVGTTFLLIYVAFKAQLIPWTVALLPVLLMLEIMVLIGLGMLLAAIGAYFRDLKEFATVGCLVMMYMLPVFFAEEWVPDALKPVLIANPFSHVIWCFHDVFFHGQILHPWSWVVVPVLATLAFTIGYAVFRRLKPGFGNVL